GHDAQAADQDARFLLLEVIDQESGKSVDVHVGQAAHRLREHRQPLGDGEHVLLGRVVRDGDDHVVENAGGALDDVEVAAGERVEAAGVDGEAGHAGSVTGRGGVVNASDLLRSKSLQLAPERAPIIFPSSDLDVPSASSDRIRRSTETEESDASILATRLWLDWTIFARSACP